VTCGLLTPTRPRAPQIIARVLGHLTTLAMSFAVFPIARNSVWEALWGIPFERAVKYHRALGRLVWAWVTAHMLMWQLKWAKEGALSQCARGEWGGRGGGGSECIVHSTPRAAQGTCGTTWSPSTTCTSPGPRELPPCTHDERLYPHPPPPPHRSARRRQESNGGGDQQLVARRQLDHPLCRGGEGSLTGRDASHRLPRMPSPPPPLPLLSLRLRARVGWC
jgi:hypothetical protein